MDFLNEAVESKFSPQTILQVYNRIPYPVRDGGVKAFHHTAACLEKLGHRVRWFCLNPSRNRVEPHELPSDFGANRRMQTVNLKSHVSLLGALFSLLQHKPYHLARFENDEVASELRRSIQKEKPDAVLVEGLAMGLYLPLFREFKLKVFYRAHNIESDLLLQKAKSYPGWHPLSWWLHGEYSKMRVFEQHLLSQSDAVLAISPEDAQGLQKLMPIDKSLITLGYWPEASSASSEPRGRSNRLASGNEAQPKGLNLGFIGTLDWLPNLDAVQWFLADWYPNMLSVNPRPTFHVAGRKMPPGLGSRLPGVVVHGEVEDATAFMMNCDLLVMPLRMGSGLKIKALEAIALGIPLLSTSKGVQGLGLKPYQDYWPAENSVEFLEGLQKLNQNPELLESMIQNAKQSLAETHEPEVQMKNLAALFQPLNLG